MNKSFKLKSIVLLFMLLATSSFVQAQKNNSAKILIDIDKSIHHVSPTLFGVFFEDINLSTDGGIYPEMVRNRSFEDADTLQYWKFINKSGTNSASIINSDIVSDKPLNSMNRKFLSIKANGEFNLINDGYWGMNVVKGNSYQFKIAIRSDNFNSPFQVKIVADNGNELAVGVVSGINGDWKYYTLNLSATENDAKAHLEISANGKGNLCLDMVSLIPSQTWKNHGLRSDLAEAVNALHPKFFRFPGGCWVEGEDLKHMYHWKNTIGNIDVRIPLWNIWGYNATQGLGFHEYLQMAEDLGAEPLFCVNVGMSHKDVVPMDQMGQWVQDVLDAIEYANGSENSVWGSIRAKNGHPLPFNLKYLEIGNENGGDAYAERWKLIANTVHQKYPDLNFIANNWGGYPKSPMPAYIDEHYYSNPDWFIWNANQYDTYDRMGPKIFVGEYAVTDNTGKGNLRGAIGEAAWMAGMERNSDIVKMGSYAPLLCNANHLAWPINLINFDSKNWYGLPSYYVQKLFAQNQGTVVLQAKVENTPAIKVPNTEGRIGLGTWNNAAEFKDLKVVASNGKILYQSNFKKNIDDWIKTGGEWSVKDGVLRQSAIAPNIAAFVGDKNWADYTITLKARKLSGDNGIQIYFRNQKNDERKRWEVGGWGNSTTMMDFGMTFQTIKEGIETNRWYDLKVVLKGNNVKGYLDGKLLQDVTDSKVNSAAINISAVKDERTGDIILKVINASFDAINTQINLSGVTQLTGLGTATILTSVNALDENTLAEPQKVFPKTEEVKFSGNQINHTFSGNSLTVFRLSTLK